LGVGPEAKVCLLTHAPFTVTVPVMVDILLKTGEATEEVAVVVVVMVFYMLPVVVPVLVAARGGAAAVLEDIPALGEVLKTTPAVLRPMGGVGQVAVAAVADLAALILVGAVVESV
jgi:hypothetical protein